MHIDDIDGFQVLSMLKLDDETRDIPVLTYTTEYRTAEEIEDDVRRDASDYEMFTTARPAVPDELMNGIVGADVDASDDDQAR